MIIKSLSGKTKSFRKLYAYINRKSEVPFYISRNLNLHDLADGDAILEAFEQNSRLLPKRKNGNYLYHEIFSIPLHSNVPLERQIFALFDVVYRYLEQRAEKLLTYGRMHLENHHLHFHLMLSSNEIGSHRRYRLPKARFSKIQKGMEAYLQSAYPELQQKPVYTKPNQDAKQTDKEFQYSKRTGKPGKKAILKETLIQIFSEPQTREECEAALLKEGLAFYQRGKNIVVTDGKLKCRLKTLGLEENFYTMMQRAEKIEQRKMELASIVAMQNSRLQHDSQYPPQIRMM